MTREQVYERANKVFRELFDDDSIIVKDETTADDIKDWDSFEHINLICALEEEFGMEFSMGEVTELHNVGEAVDIILERATK